MNRNAPKSEKMHKKKLRIARIDANQSARIRVIRSFSFLFPTGNA